MEETSEYENKELHTCIHRHVHIQIHARIYTRTILYIYLLTTLNYLIAYEYIHAD